MAGWWKRILVAGLTILLSGNPHPTYAQETNVKNGEVVFLLDTSASMNKQDEERLALDAVRQMAGCLPSNYKTGLVAYNTGIQAVLPLDSSYETIDTQLGGLSYTGYTNAGEGLNQAMGLFSEAENIDRYILFLTDGEIDMPDEPGREISRALYEESAVWAKNKGVKIYIAAIGMELNNPQMQIFEAAEITDGAIYWEGASGSLSDIMGRIATERFDFPRQNTSILNNENSISAEIPAGASRVKLILRSDAGIGNAVAAYQAESGKIINGQRFAVVDLYGPDSESVDVTIQCPDPASVHLFQIAEYKARPQVEVNYRIEQLPRTEKEIKKDTPPVYDHYADITIQMADLAGKNNNLWGGSTFEGKEISYTINDVSYTGRLQSGKLSNTISAEGIDQIEVTVNTTGMDALYEVEQPVTAIIEKAPDPVFEPKPDYWPLLIILGLLALAISLLFFWWAKKGRATVVYQPKPDSPGDSAKKMETRSCSYTGKFNIYVVRTSDGKDVAPQTYRLFGRSGGRLTLNQILTSCGIRFEKIGANEVIFNPGPDNTVIIMDQSERCTVMRGSEILKKGVGYAVSYNDKLTVSFEDEATELEIHYKNLKPSERGA